MDENFITLFNKFKKIKQKGYIKAINNNSSAIGLTFEEKLDLSKNNFCMPDYKGIEIKTKSFNSKSTITLFSAIPNGENLFEMERLKNMYGYPYKYDKKYKVLRAKISGKCFTYGGYTYKYKLQINNKDEKVYLCIYNKYDRLIEQKVFWTFDYLKEKLYNKLKYLAIIKADTKIINNWKYFNYNKITFYKLKDFETFLSLLKTGIITLNFNIGIHLDKKRYGKTLNHGCAFTIYEKNINNLYSEYKIKKSPTRTL